MTAARILFATAELAPIARVGGLAEASSGLVRALRAEGVAVELVVPDYSGVELHDEEVIPLAGRSWTGPLTVRRGIHVDVGELTLVGGAGLAKPHPYVDADGAGWPDNDHRFSVFAAAVAELADDLAPDVVHLNDWHTALVPALTTGNHPTVLTVHTLGYQGGAGPWLLDRLERERDQYRWWDGANPLLGGIRLADRIVTVSPTYAAEILTPDHGMGLDLDLRARSADLIGIRNGIDPAEWNPATDAHLAAGYTGDDPAGKRRCRAALCNELGWTPDARAPVLGMVSRLVDQKGIDLVADTARFLEGIGARLVVVGAGQRHHVDRLRQVATEQPERVAFVEGYDVALGHRVFAGADLYLMPSRFEPCGLAQMQAMAYGTMPVVTDVGGLHDTVVDADLRPDQGTGFVASAVDAASVVDAVHRATRAWRNVGRRSGIIARGMAIDWSWTEPARRHIELYDELADRHARSPSNRWFFATATTPPDDSTTP